LKAEFGFIASSFESAADHLASEKFVERLNLKKTSFATLMPI
jgi:hypothetical protein